MNLIALLSTSNSKPSKVIDIDKDITLIILDNLKIDPWLWSKTLQVAETTELEIELLYFQLHNLESPEL
jgi:hypothetical protein